MIDIPYSFITFLAHYLVLKLDNRRFIKISDLINFRQLLIQKFCEIELKKSHIKYEINLIVDDTKEIFNLIKDNPQIFYLKNNCICLYDNIDIKFLNDFINKNFLDFKFFFKTASENSTVRHSLGITKIYDLARQKKEEILKIEEQLEEAYKNLTISDSTIKLLLAKRFIYFINMSLNYPVIVEEFESLFEKDEYRESFITPGYDYLKNSIYTQNNEDYPIDNELYCESEFYEDAENIDNPIQCCIEDIYQYAIFGKGKLFSKKMMEMFDQLDLLDFLKKINSHQVKEYLDENTFENFDDLDDNNLPSDDRTNFIVSIDFDALQSEFTFWLTYLHKLNEYLYNNEDQNLIQVKLRLLYLLDNIKNCLYVNENLEKVYTKTIDNYFNDFNRQIDDDLPYDYLGWEACYFIEDCFLGHANKTVEKLLFIATYYYLTNDQTIMENLAQFKNHPKYNEYEAIITGKGNSRKRKIN